MFTKQTVFVFNLLFGVSLIFKWYFHFFIFYSVYTVLFMLNSVKFTINSNFFISNEIEIFNNNNQIPFENPFKGHWNFIGCRLSGYLFGLLSISWFYWWVIQIIHCESLDESHSFESHSKNCIKCRSYFRRTCMDCTILLDSSW